MVPALEAMKRHLDVDLKVRHYSACEIDPQCRRLLLQSVPEIEHVFGDLLERWPLSLREDVEHMQEAEVNSFSHGGLCSDGSRVPVEMWNVHGTKFFHDAATHLLSDGVLANIEKTGWCYRHSKRCPLHPEASNESAPFIHIDISGNTCTPWSMAGSRRGWCDKASLASLCWGQHLHIASPALVLNECTPKWPASLFFSVFLTSTHSCTSLHISPVDLGLPCARPRLYTLAYKEATIGMTRDWRALVVDACYRRLVSTAKIYFIAPESELASYVTEVARRRHIDLPAGAALEARDLLSPDARERLRAYKRAITPSITRTTEVAAVDISQNLSHSGSARPKEIMPTLKGSSVGLCCVCLGYRVGIKGTAEIP